MHKMLIEIRLVFKV